MTAGVCVFVGGGGCDGDIGVGPGGGDTTHKTRPKKISHL